MEIQEAALSSFILLEASWSPEQSLQLISDLQPTHVIVHRGEPPQDYYYLFQADWTLEHLKVAGPDINSALELHEEDAIHFIPGAEDSELAPDRCIVHEEGRIIGFFDADYLGG